MQQINRLLEIMNRLRDRDCGCPWDLKQTGSSLRDYILEEAYELIDAIDSGSIDAIREELGDLLLQVVFLSRIHDEQGEFDFEAVARTIADKLVSRHPHIFGDTSVNGADEVKRNWEKIKMSEKKKRSILSEYPETMPALLTAARISSQAASVGFDWPNARQALDKVREELDELEKELDQPDDLAVTQEFGDLLFALVNVARLLRINSEFALRRSTEKFIRRFRFIEETIANSGKTLQESNPEEMEMLWTKAKTAVG